MKRRNPPKQFLRVEEILPALDLADCWKKEEVVAPCYRLPSHHLMLIESGGIVAHPPTGRVEATKGDLVCFRPAEFNQYTTRRATLFYQAIIRFAPPPRDRWTPLLGEFGPLPIRVSLGASFEAARSIFETLCAEVTLEGPAHELRLRAAVLNLLALVTDVLSAQPLQIESLDDWERLRLRLASQLREELNVGDLARSMHMSPSYLIRHFKKLFGASPKAYHTQCRLREAIRLLRETNLSIKFIALDLGFISAKNFQHIFKHHCGVSPLEARTKKLYPANEPSAAASNPFLINRFNLRPPVDPHWMKRFTPAAAEFIKRGLPVPPS